VGEGVKLAELVMDGVRLFDGDGNDVCVADGLGAAAVQMKVPGNAALLPVPYGHDTTHRPAYERGDEPPNAESTVSVNNAVGGSQLVQSELVPEYTQVRHVSSHC
jgi:hypothetical protein